MISRTPSSASGPCRRAPSRASRRPSASPLERKADANRYFLLRFAKPPAGPLRRRGVPGAFPRRQVAVPEGRPRSALRCPHPLWLARGGVRTGPATGGIFRRSEGPARGGGSRQAPQCRGCGGCTASIRFVRGGPACAPGRLRTLARIALVLGQRGAGRRTRRGTAARACEARGRDVGGRVKDSRSGGGAVGLAERLPGRGGVGGLRRITAG